MIRAIAVTVACLGLSAGATGWAMADQPGTVVVRGFDSEGACWDYLRSEHVGQLGVTDWCEPSADGRGQWVRTT